jgi:hypothetical protein
MQVYAPTRDAQDEIKENVYDQLQNLAMVENHLHGMTW